MYQNILDMILVLLYNAFILNKYENLKKIFDTILFVLYNAFYVTYINLKS